MCRQQDSERWYNELKTPNQTIHFFEIDRKPIEDSLMINDAIVSIFSTCSYDLQQLQLRCQNTLGISIFLCPLKYFAVIDFSLIICNGEHEEIISPPFFPANGPISII